MKKFFIYFSVIFTTILVVVTWILGFCLLLNLLPATVYEWLQTNLSAVNDLCNTIKNFTNVQSIAFYILLGSGLLLIILFGMQYPLSRIASFRRMRPFFTIPLYSIGFAGLIVSLVLLFVNLL